MGAQWVLVRAVSGPVLDYDECRHRYRVCPYVDDWVIAPSFGRATKSADSHSPSTGLHTLLERYDQTRNPSKGAWGGGAQVLEHLGFVIDTVNGTFEVPAVKMEKTEMAAMSLISMARCNPRRVPAKVLSPFFGRAQSLRLAVPDTPLLLRALYDALHGVVEECDRAARGSFLSLTKRAATSDRHAIK